MAQCQQYDLVAFNTVQNRKAFATKSHNPATAALSHIWSRSPHVGKIKERLHSLSYRGDRSLGRGRVLHRQEAKKSLHIAQRPR